MLAGNGRMIEPDAFLHNIKTDTILPTPTKTEGAQWKPHEQ